MLQASHLNGRKRNMPEKYIPKMTLKNLQDFAITNMDKYREFMQGRKRLKRKKR